MRAVYLNALKEMNLKLNQLIKLLKPLDRLAESGDYRGGIFGKYLEMDF